MLSRRLQVLIDEERYRRLAERARELGVSVAAVIRDAIDAAVPATDRRKAKALREILNAPPMEVGSVEELRAELDDAHDRFR